MVLMVPTARRASVQWVACQIRPLVQLAQGDPLCIVCDCDRDPSVGACAVINTVGRIPVVPVPQRFFYTPVHLVVQDRFRDAGAKGLSHGEIHVLALPGHRPVIQGGGSDHSQLHTHPGVGPQPAGYRLPLWIPGDGVPARIVLKQAAVGHMVFVRTGMPCPGGGQHDDVRPCHPDYVVPQAQAFYDAGGEVLNHHV